MATLISIVKGPNSFAIAKLRRNDIKWWWTKYHPTSISVLQSQSGGVGSVVGGAVVGGLLLGGVGALVGGMAGGKAGQVTFTVETAEGRTLTCQCKAGEFAGVHVAISKMIERRLLQGSRVERRQLHNPQAARGGCLKRIGWVALVVLGLSFLLPLLLVILVQVLNAIF